MAVRKPICATAASGLALAAALLVTGHVEQPTVLEQIYQKGELVVATRNGPTTFYEGPGGPAGFEYDLAKLFAEFLGVDLKLVVATQFQAILPMVARREAHLAAAGLTVTEARKRRVRFGPSYDEITPQLVYRSGTAPPDDLGGIVDDPIEVIAGSSHAERLRMLASELPRLQWRENSEADVDELLAGVWNNELKYTIADSNDVRLNQQYYPELRVALDLAAPQQLAWAFPKGQDSSLYDEAARFFTMITANGQLDQLKERHYGHVREFDYVGTRKFFRHITERLTQYQPIFQEAAAESGQDWRLLAAIGYQESHWDPRAISPTGVRGIMMLTRATAAALGIRNRIDPANSIRGGARYLRQLKQGIPASVAEPDRTWFALAAYNLGLGHVMDAREITRKRGRDPDKWVDLKKNLPLLMHKRWYRHTEHGYARGIEAVGYVEGIRSYYDMLVWRTDQERPQTAAVTAIPATYSAVMRPPLAASFL